MRYTNRTCPVFGPTMAENANFKLLLLPKCMAGGFVITRTDSAQFSIEIRLARGSTVSESQTPSGVHSLAQYKRFRSSDVRLRRSPNCNRLYLDSQRWLPNSSREDYAPLLVSRRNSFTCVSSAVCKLIVTTRRRQELSLYAPLIHTTASRRTCDCIYGEFHFDITATGAIV